MNRRAGPRGPSAEPGDGPPGDGPPGDGPPGDGPPGDDPLSDPGEPDPEIRDALRAILASQDDVRSVVAVGVHRRLLGRSLTGTLFDLGGAGWETVRHLLTNPPSDADMEDDREVPTNEIDP